MRVPLIALVNRALHNHSVLQVPGNASSDRAAPSAGASSGTAPALLQSAETAWSAVALYVQQHAVTCALVGFLCGCTAGVSIWLLLRFFWPEAPAAEPESVPTTEQTDSPRNLEEVEQRRQHLTSELDKLKEKEQALSGEPLTHSAMPTLRDYDQLLRTLVQEGLQRVLPTLSRGQAIRNIAETRAHNFTTKAKAFVLNELNGAAGELCEAFDAPEAMLLLDLDAAAAAHFPPVAVLLAGLITPYLLQLMLIMHITQLVFVLIPYGALVTWAMTVDLHAQCQAIPFIAVWLWVQLVLVYMLIWARFVIVLQIREGQWRLNAKSSKAREAHLNRTAANSGATTTVQGLMDLRELFVSQASLVQEVMVLEDRVRSGSARHIVGAATLLWLLVMLWTFILVLRFALVPGEIEFYSPYYAKPEHYCGAWATVLTARISCVVAAVVLGTNLATVCHWLSDVVVSSETFSNFIMRYAQRFDESLLGLPVAQLLAKAFLLRDSSDMTFTRLAVALHERAALSSELRETEAKLESLRLRLSEKEASVLSLKRDTDGLRQVFGSGSSAGAGSTGAGPGADLPEAMDMAAWMQVWRQRGKEAIDTAQQRAVEVQQVRTEDFERIVQRIAGGTEQLRQSVENVRSASSGAQDPVAAALDAARTELNTLGQQFSREAVLPRQSEEQLERGREAFRSALEQSGPALQAIVTQVVETSQQVGQQLAERVREISPEVLERGQEVVGRGQEAVQRGIERLREYNPEVVERVEQLQSDIMPMVRQHSKDAARLVQAASGLEGVPEEAAEEAAPSTSSAPASSSQAGPGTSSQAGLGAEQTAGREEGTQRGEEAGSGEAAAVPDTQEEEAAEDEEEAETASSGEAEGLDRGPSNVSFSSMGTA